MLRPRVLHVCVALALLTIVAFLLQAHPPSALSRYASSTGNEPTSALHLLIVATSSDLNLCRLLLSAAVLGYPQPVLIDWEGDGEFNAAKTHLAKVAGTLRYLESLSPDQDDEQVLLLDGFDVLFQLGPDVLLRRYFAATEAANAQLASQRVYNSILFGPDKMCWPLDFSRPACWAVPEPPLAPYAFGPNTDADMERARPRWLNSGTVMGPAGDMRALFRATKERIEQTFDQNNEDRNSDQMYLADVWGDQEYARALALHGEAADPMPHMAADVQRASPALEAGRPTDYHVGLDYDSLLFQTSAGYRRYLAWMTFNKTAVPTPHTTVEPWNMDLPDDILKSRLPFSRLANERLKDVSWRDVSLGANVVTGVVFPLFHFTGDKSFRDLWWSRMWYFDQAEQLLQASAKSQDDQISDGPIHGTRWLRHRPTTTTTAATTKGSKGGTEQARAFVGAWSDQGQRLPWDSICKQHEAVMYSGAVPRPPWAAP